MQLVRRLVLVAVLAAPAFAKTPVQPPDHRSLFASFSPKLSVDVDLDFAIVDDAGAVTGYRADCYLWFGDGGSVDRRVRRSRHDAASGAVKYVGKGPGVSVSAKWSGGTLTAFRLRADVRDRGGVRHKITYRMKQVDGYDVLSWQ